MRVWSLSAPGLEHLNPEERPDPTPGPGQVLIRIKAASLNYRDVMVATGRYTRGAKYPLVPLSDGAGEIAAVGSGVTAWRPGDRVVTSFFAGWVDGPQTPERAATALGGAIDGVLAEAVVLPERAVVRTPEHMSDVEAATLPCAAVTAWHALFEGVDPLRPGQTVLLEGTGGVSIFGLQLAKLAGARVIITSSQDAKLERGQGHARAFPRCAPLRRTGPPDRRRLGLLDRAAPRSDGPEQRTRATHLRRLGRDVRGHGPSPSARAPGGSCAPATSSVSCSSTATAARRTRRARSSSTSARAPATSCGLAPAGLGTCFARGTGVPLDAPRAHELFTRACDGHKGIGCKGLGDLARDVDPVAAAGLYRQSCDLGYAGGCSYLGDAMVSGTGIAHDRAKGLDLLRRGCKGEYTWACQRLDELHERP